jgi:hypothetical protein
MQPIFLKEPIILERHRHSKNPFEEEEAKEDEEEGMSLTSSNLFSEAPKSPKKTKRRDSYSSKEIEMKSIIFN